MWRVGSYSVSLRSNVVCSLRQWHYHEARTMSTRPTVPSWVPTECDTNAKCLLDNSSTSRPSSSFPVTDPSSGQEIAHVADFTADDATATVERATIAQRSWAFLPMAQRSNVLMQWHKNIMERRQELASLIVLEMGKPLAQALGEVDYGASFIQYYAEQVKRLHGEIIPDPRSNQRKLLLQWEPLGVAGLITPWNFPIAMITRKAASALAVGCTTVLKPSEDTPLSAMALAELWSIIPDSPAGVFNVVPCSRARAAEVGSVLCTHDAVGAVSVTGSTRTGKIVMQQSASTLKRMSLELGGNAPLIVFPSANMDLAVAGCMATKFRNSGQTCICANRIYVHEAVYDEFVEKLSDKIHQLKTGDGFEQGVDIGPLVNERAVEKIEALMKESVRTGAQVLIGGERAEKGSCLFQPTLVTNVTSSTACAREEIFGPVASIIKFGEGMSLRESEENVLQQANAGTAGLAAYFFTEDYRQMWRVSQRLQYGIVGANEAAVTMDVAPSSGRKESGLGSEGSHHGFSDYVEIKYICMGGNFDMSK
ncbi:succinate-semialdehyde dehydrogenase [NADP(+)] GabD-like [Sycon ciliatum]|uniref:succinate-semialdehyde dehydrogenase [NADP(+)] GabD-like n=1 Tax=Sycon ciliatum TaxID=27933 RepID=UPI0031F6BDDE